MSNNIEEKNIEKENNIEESETDSLEKEDGNEEKKTPEKIVKEYKNRHLLSAFVYFSIILYLLTDFGKAILILYLLLGIIFSFVGWIWDTKWVKQKYEKGGFSDSEIEELEANNKTFYSKIHIFMFKVTILVFTVFIICLIIKGIIWLL